MRAARHLPHSMPARLSSFFLRSAFIVALVLIFVLAMIPQPVVPMVVDFQDKVEHCAAFAVLMLMGRAGWPTRAIRLGIGLIGYGVLIEVAQHTLTTNRIGDPLDVLADSVGVAIGLLLVRQVAIRRLAGG